jgi:heterodisulfide reductase subunit A
MEEGKEARIGVFVCRCGKNIAGTVNVGEVRAYAETLSQVVVAEEHLFACSEDGQRVIKDAIKKHKLNRVIVASCTPRTHEPIFKAAVEEAGLNPYLFEMVNIREQCSFVHERNPEKATEKAKDLIRMGVARARFLEPLESMKEKVVDKALVVGGGMAGITTALNLAKYGFKVYLIERKPYLGGKIADLGRVFPTDDCATCIPSVESCGPRRGCLYSLGVALPSNLTIYTSSEIEEVTGYIGNFTAKIMKRPNYVNMKRCTFCGLCEDVCPIEISENFNLGKRKAVYMSFPQVYPHSYIIDVEACNRCGKCVDACPAKAINLKDEAEEVELHIGTIVVATGYEEYDPSGVKEYGYGEYRNVMTQLQLAKLLDHMGPTKGEVIRPSDKERPKKMVMIQCVGSRDSERNPYCSKICCMIALKHSLAIKERHPQVDVTIIHKDIRLAGRNYEDYYRKAEDAGIRFARGNVLRVDQDEKSQSLILHVRTFKGKEETLRADLVVLTAGLVPSKGTEELAHILGLSTGPDGFFKELHPKLAPIDTAIGGIYLCGCCQAPKDIPETVAQACAAASRAAIPMAKKEVTIEPMHSVVDKEKCIGCDACVGSCIYNAIEASPFGLPSIAEANCKGCGVCAAECPMGAMQLIHFKDEQIVAAIEALFESEKFASSSESFEPVALCFACQWCSYAAADLAGISRIQYPPNVRILRVPCSGRVDVLHVLKAFLNGADGVIITGCNIGDCHYIDGNVKAKNRVYMMKKSLKAIGIDPERLEIGFASSSEGQKFATMMTNFVERIRKLGPNPLRTKEGGD